MNLTETEIKDCYIIEWDEFMDDRGVFTVPFNVDDFNRQTNLDFKIVQENESMSIKNVVRGLHFQKQPYEQAKLVRCTTGEVTDVIVDMRNDSPTYGNVVKVKLKGLSTRSVFVPRGCAHGFSTQTEAIFNYKVDNQYNKESEGGVLYNDPQLNIDWEVEQEPIISEKDLLLPFFKDLDIYS
jgi:dTDP-4-dehydrorhamnose 3,5-epimerase